MGVDLVTRLVYGVDVRRRGRDGRSFLDRVVAGEFGAYDGDPDLPFGSLEEHFVEDVGFSVLAAVDHYGGEEVGAVAGVCLLQVANRDTPRNLTEGLTEAEFVARMRDAKKTLDRYGIKDPTFWLTSYAG